MINSILFGKDRNRKIHFIITFAYFLIHLFLLYKHEHWFDEAQAWILVKNLSLRDVIKLLPTEGHPALWFVFLYPFAKLDFSFYYFSYISLTIMTITVYIYLEKAPFSLLIKCGTLLSSMFLFYNPVVTRTYSLIALIVVLLAYLYNQKSEKPIMFGLLVSLLLQSHVVAFGLAIGLLIDLVIDFFKNREKKLLIPITMIMVSFLLMVFEIMPRSDLPSGIDTSISGIFNNLKMNIIKERLSYFAYTAMGMPKNAGFLSFFPYILLMICVILLFVFISINKGWKENYKIIIVAICGIGEFFAVLLLIYTPHTQMASILVMILLFVMWQLYSNNVNYNVRWVAIIMLGLISFFTFIVTQSVMRQDIFLDYSASKKAAEIIETQLDEKGLLIIDNNDDDVTVYAYVSSKRKDIEFYDAKNDREFTIHQLGIVYDGVELEKVLDIANKRSENNREVFYLTSIEKNDSRLELIYKSEKSITRDKYFIYLIK